jgi:ADP-ribose pyrophosphatase YjhB (NUDIX family)
MSHKTPKLTVDIIIELAHKEDHIVMIERKNPPHGYALPGGFVDIGETTMQAAIREAEEETGLLITDIVQFHTYSNPNRDPREHCVTVCYVAQALGEPKAADDAKNIVLFNTKDFCFDGNMNGGGFVASLEGPAINNICFDHGQMIVDYMTWKKSEYKNWPTRE